MFETVHIKAAILAAELHQVQRGQITGRIIKEHVFRTRVGGADFACCRAGMPIIDCGVVLDAGISRRPGGIADLFPKLAGFDRFDDITANPADQVPVVIGLNRIEEAVRHPDRIVGILARHSEIGL